jgi:hypothetical protein
MKKHIVILILALSTCSINAQEYFKFPTSNALWQSIVTGSMSPPFEWIISDSLGEQIIIENLSYSEVYSGIDGIGAIREDTNERKIYFNDFYNEIVLYDFTLESGDTIFYSTLNSNIDYYKVVDSINFINISGQSRKRWFLSNSLYDLKDIWIEGIGSVHRYGLLYPNQPYIVTDGSTPYFGCFTSTSVTYIDENSCSNSCPCDSWLVGENEKPNIKMDIEIFPNPTKDLINIDLNNNKYQYLEIYNSNYKLVYKTKISNQNKIKINTSFFSKGLYSVKFTKENNYEVHKIIKR